MRIGLDFDGVISDCGDLKARGLKEMYGIDVDPHIVKKEHLVGAGILTLDQYRTMQKIVYGDAAIGVHMIPVVGALERIAKLLEDGHDVSVVTSRHGIGMEIAQTWLHGRGIDIPFQSAEGSPDKSTHLRGFTVFVDDDLEKLLTLDGIVPHRFLFSWKYNEHEKSDSAIIRISSWNELYRKIAELAAS